MDREYPMPPATYTAETRLQQLMMERALAMAKELERTGRVAPDGRVLDHLETAAVAQGREFTRAALEGALQGQIDEIEKKLRTPPLRMRAKSASQRGVAAHGPDGGRQRETAARLLRLWALRGRRVCGRRGVGDRGWSIASGAAFVVFGRHQLVVCRGQRELARNVRLGGGPEHGA